MKTLIIAGGIYKEDFVKEYICPDDYNYIIAVDKGLSYTESLNLFPDLIVGDFDSVRNSILSGYDSKIIRRYKPEKDDTDMEIAMKQAVIKNQPIDVLCATGGRADHFLGNIHTLKIAIDAGLHAEIIDENNRIFLIDKEYEFEKGVGKYVSFIPFSGDVKGITLKGFRYNVEKFTLNPGSTRCVSNEVSEKKAAIHIDEGCLIAVIASDVKSE